MNPPIVQSPVGVTLVGGGPVTAAGLAAALARAPRLVAADRGADRLLRLGHTPEAVIGDFDSISDMARERLADRLFPLAEQETTDFDKALRSIDAPFVLALGFSGARMDHGLAVLNTLVRQGDRACIVVSPTDVIFHAPPALDLSLRPGDRFSLFPMARVTGQSTGLEWPIGGIRFEPDGMIGTSNRVTARLVSLRFDSRGMLVILPRGRLDAAITALAGPMPRSPARGGGLSRPPVHGG